MGSGLRSSLNRAGLCRIFVIQRAGIYNFKAQLSGVDILIVAARTVHDVAFRAHLGNFLGQLLLLAHQGAKLAGERFLRARSSTMCPFTW